MTRNNLIWSTEEKERIYLQGLWERDLWYKNKRSNTHVTGVLKGEEKKIGTEKNWKLQEIIAETCPNLMEKHKFTDSGSSANLKKDKRKENHAQTHHTKTTENQS